MKTWKGKTFIINIWTSLLRNLWQLIDKYTQYTHCRLHTFLYVLIQTNSGRPHFGILSCTVLTFWISPFLSILHHPLFNLSNLSLWKYAKFKAGVGKIWIPRFKLYKWLHVRTAILIYTEANRQSVTLPPFSSGIK